MQNQTKKSEKDQLKDEIMGVIMQTLDQKEKKN